MAGMAAFELALQYLLIRQDRSYHFVQLLTALLSLVFLSQLALMTWLSVVLPLMPFLPDGPFERLREFSHPLATVLSLVALLLVRATKTKFAIEPGDQTIERLNKDLLEPCLGIKFDVETGKLYSDHRQDGAAGMETFYSLRYSSPESVPPAATQRDSHGGTVAPATGYTDTSAPDT